MTDLWQVLPDFDLKPFSHLLHSLEKALISTNDLLTLNPAVIANRAKLPSKEVKKLADAAIGDLHRHLGFGAGEAPGSSVQPTADTHHSWPANSHCISTLDEKLDTALAGGIPTGHLVEVTGESGAGKTQLLLTLLLACQLPAPRGLSKGAIYVSTESPLATNRLQELLSTHPCLAALPDEEKPSFARMLTIETTDLEAQDHVLRYQLPVAIKKHNVGLVVIDSVAANFRAEFESNRERDGGASLAKRGKELMQLGAMLRRLAREEGVAVVVANQVGDRFTKPPSSTPSRTTSANTEQSERGPASAGTPHAIQATPGGNDQLAKSSAGSRLLVSPDPLALDHQQRWFTGWGDIADAPAYGLKTPSLGHVWTNQLSCRIALLKEPVFTSRPLVVSVNGEDRLNEDVHVSKWQRWLKVVFAAWAPPSEGRGVPFELSGSGIRHLPS